MCAHREAKVDSVDPAFLSVTLEEFDVDHVERLVQAIRIRQAPENSLPQ